MALMRPVPVERVLELGEEWAAADNLVASGPFLLSRESVPGTQTVLVRNPYWPIAFNGNVDRVNLLQLSAEEAYDLWSRNRLDLAPVPDENQAQVLNRYDTRVELVPGQAVFYLAFNYDSPAFSSPALRRAFGAAIDRDRLIREVHGGQALPMRHFAPPGIFGAPLLDEVGTGYSPDLARQELAASGFGDCRLLPPLRILVSSSDLALQQVELIRDMWMEELGCLESQFTIEQAQFGALLANTQANAQDRPDMWELGWASAYPDENNWVGEVIHCTESENRQRRPCSQIDDIIRQAAVLDAQDGRVDLYRQIERALFGEGGELPLIPLFVRAEYALRQGWLNYRPAPFGGEQYDTYFVDAGVKELERGR
jgi:ABC-type oligopeptide transport system substrate-binding subunit